MHMQAEAGDIVVHANHALLKSGARCSQGLRTLTYRSEPLACEPR